MYRRDLNSDIRVASAITPQALTTSDVNGSVIDRAGFETIEFVGNVSTGTIDGTNFITVRVFEGDLLANGNNPVFSNLTEVAATDLLDGTVAVTAAGAFKVGYIGYRRFVAIQFDVTGTVAVTASGTSILANPHLAPVDKDV